MKGTDMSMLTAEPTPKPTGEAEPTETPPTLYVDTPGGGTHRDVRNYLHRLSPDYLGKPFMETLLAYVDKAERSDFDLVEEKKRGDDHLAAYVRRGDFIAKMAGECGYKPLGEATVEDQLAFGIAALNRNLNGEIAEHQRHHDVEARLNAKLSEAKRKLAEAEERIEQLENEPGYCAGCAAAAPAMCGGAYCAEEAAQEPVGGEPAKPDPRLADALANPPGPRHARLVEPAKPPVTIKLREPTQSRMPAGGVTLLDEQPEAKPPAPASQFKVGQRVVVIDFGPQHGKEFPVHAIGGADAVRVKLDDGSILSLLPGDVAPADLTPTSTEGPSPFVTRAELALAIRKVCEGKGYMSHRIWSEIADELEKLGIGEAND